MTRIAVCVFRPSPSQCQHQQQQPTGGGDGRLCQCQLCCTQDEEGSGIVGDLSHHAAQSASRL